MLEVETSWELSLVALELRKKLTLQILQLKVE
jgi:hypothetical protein